MSDPKRLVEGGGLGATLLGSARGDRPLGSARARAAAAVGVGVGAAALTGSGTAAGAGTAKIATATGLWLKLLAAGVVATAVTGAAVVATTREAPPPAETKPVATLRPPADRAAPSLTRRASEASEASEEPRETPSRSEAKGPSSPERGDALRVSDKPSGERVAGGSAATTTRVAATARPAAPAPAPAPAAAPATATAEALNAPPSKPVDATVAETSVPDPRPPSTLRQEVEALDGARRALAKSDGPRALLALDGYDRAYPRGVLRQEADVLRAEALLATGDAAAARALARRLLGAQPNGPAAKRLRTIAGE